MLLHLNRSLYLQMILTNKYVYIYGSGHLEINPVNVNDVSMSVM